MLAKCGHGKNYAKELCKPCYERQRPPRIYKPRPGHYAKYKECNRRAKLKQKFGITPEQYDALLSKQFGVCAICSNPPTGRRLCVDHEHDSGKVRGLLCVVCNTRLGWLECLDKNGAWVTAARKYKG